MTGDIELVPFDVWCPGIDGFEVCRRLRAGPGDRVPAGRDDHRLGRAGEGRALDAGADDFVAKPFDQAELLARVRSLLRVKPYHDEIEAFNRGLRRFLPAEVAALVKNDPSMLDSHRREIAVRSARWRASRRSPSRAEPEDVMAVLNAYHSALGALVDASEGALVRLTGDELTVVFNDPSPCEEPAARRGAPRARAARPRLGARRGLEPASASSSSSPAGVSLGHATIGRIGSDQRWEYAPVGTVPTLAERLCESAAGGQILISQRAFAATEGLAITQEVGELELRGFSKPARAYDLLGLES